MPFYLVNKYGRPAHDEDTKELFGLDRKAKWPKEGLEARRIQDILCWVERSDPDPTKSPHRGQWPSGPRAQCRCPLCHLTLPIGRLRQHIKHSHPADL